MSSADEPVYIPGQIYTVNDRDWLLSRGSIEDNIDTEAMPHLLEIYADYSMAEESADNSGVFEFFLSCLITHFENWKSSHYAGNARSQAPNIRVDVLPSPCAILLGAKNVNDLVHGARVVSDFFQNPYVPEGNRVSQDFFRGTCWHNDSVLRMGLNSIALRPLMIHHDAPVLEAKMKALAAELSPHRSDRAHLFVTNTPALIGTVFTDTPTPMTEDAFLRQTDRPTPAYSQRGHLETDDLSPLLSAAAPISAEAFVAYDILTGFLYFHLEKLAGNRADLIHTQALWNDHIIISFAGHGSWTAIDAHDLVCVLLGVTNSLESPGLVAELTDDKLRELLIDSDFHERWQIQLWLRRIEHAGITEEGVREALATFLTTMHIPSRIASGPLTELFPPLLSSRGLRLPYGRGKEDAYPLELEAGDLDRHFLEPVGEQFWTGLLFDDANTIQGAPHRLAINDTEAVAEWFVHETPDSALIRRQSIAWEEILAWTTFGDSAILLDRAGRFFELVPDIFLHSEQLKSIIAQKKEHCASRGVPIRQLTAKRYRAHFSHLIQAREYGVFDDAYIQPPWQATGLKTPVAQKKADQLKKAEWPVRVSTTGTHMPGNTPNNRTPYRDGQKRMVQRDTFKEYWYYLFLVVGGVLAALGWRLG